MKCYMAREFVLHRLPILGLDPGGTVGWALAHYPYTLLSTDNPETVMCELDFSVGYLDWPADAHLLSDLITGDSALPIPHTVVVEGFRLFPQVAQAGSFTYNSVIPIEVIGFARGVHLQFIRDTGGELSQELVEQLSSIKSTMTNTVLKEMVGDDYVTNPHARDALRHIVHYIIKGHGQ